MKFYSIFVPFTVRLHLSSGEFDATFTKEKREKSPNQFLAQYLCDLLAKKKGEITKKRSPFHSTLLKNSLFSLLRSALPGILCMPISSWEMIYYFTLSLNPSPPFIRLRKSFGWIREKKVNIKSEDGKIGG